MIVPGRFERRLDNNPASKRGIRYGAFGRPLIIEIFLEYVCKIWNARLASVQLQRVSEVVLTSLEVRFDEADTGENSGVNGNWKR